MTHATLLLRFFRGQLRSMNTVNIQIKDDLKKALKALKIGGYKRTTTKWVVYKSAIILNLKGVARWLG